MFRARLILAAGLVIGISASAPSQSWTDWERENAVAREGDFLVVRQPGEGFCYVKQSYADDRSRFELLYDGGKPFINSPFLDGLAGDAWYWVDDGDKQMIPHSEISGSGGFELPAAIVDQMKAGKTLYVRANPVRHSPFTQEFSLIGFTAATEHMDSTECELADSPTTEALAVTLERTGDGRIIVHGETTLPDGMELFVDLRGAGGYFAQETVTVEDRAYRTKEGFAEKNGAALPGGEYQVSLSSSVMTFQPPKVEEALGDNGQDIPEAIRREIGDTGAMVVDHVVVRTIK